MLKFAFTLFLAFLSIQLSAQVTLIDSLPVGNFMRSYQLYLPSNVENLEEIPVVFNFHGLGSNAFQQAFYSSMNAVAEQEQFIVVYPQGWYDSFFESTFWNMGFDALLEPENLVDDEQFTRDLIDLLDEQFNIDQNRMYACGMSMGGMFSYWVACHMSDKITAVASVAGAFTLTASNNCPTTRATPLLQIHGTNDDLVPWEGATLHESIPESVGYWVEHNGCPEFPVFEELPNTNLEDGTTSSKETYADCIEGSEVVLLTVEGGAHTWPGSSTALQLGATSQDFNASVTIWDFFKDFKLDDFQTNTAIEEIIAPQWNVYCNNEVLHLEFELFERGQLKALQVFDLNGQLLISRSDEPYQKNIGLHSFPDGIYFAQIVMENGQKHSIPFLLKR